jgi:hypothetical protein
VAGEWRFISTGLPDGILSFIKPIIPILVNFGWACMKDGHSTSPQGVSFNPWGRRSPWGQFFTLGYN